MVPYELTGLMVKICASTEPATNKAHVMKNLSKVFFMIGSPEFFVISKLALEIHPPAILVNLQAFRKQGKSLDEFN
jgi:hypothetical protein